MLEFLFVIAAPSGFMHQENETSIIRRIQKGDRESFRHLVETHKDNVFGLVYRQVGDRVVAEEISQEVFVKAYRAIDRFQFRSKFSTWLTRITINTCHSYFTSKRYRQGQRTEEFEARYHSPAVESPEEEFEARQALQRFQRALAKLEPRLHEVIVLCGIEGKKYDEAAAELEIPIGTVRSRLNAARIELKRLIDEQVGEASDNA